MNKGKMLTAKPLSEDTIAKIKELLKNDPKWFSIFCVSVNSAFRATDLLRLKVDELDDDGARITIWKKESKTRKNRRVTLGIMVSDVLRKWIALAQPTDFVWRGQRGPHTYGMYSALLKRWCLEVGAPIDHVSSHSTRKAWTAIHIEKHKTPLYVLMRALNHSSEAQVLAYAGITPRDLDKAYSQEI